MITLGRTSFLVNLALGNSSTVKKNSNSDSKTESLPNEKVDKSLSTENKAKTL